MRQAKSLIILLTILVVTGCSYLPEPSAEGLISYLPVISFTSSKVTKIKLKSSKTTNHGTPFYVLVKATSFPNFLVDDYKKITTTVFKRAADHACFAVICVMPGVEKTIEVETPEDKTLAIYCLYTTPQEAWKQLIELKEVKQTVTVKLGENEIQSIDIQ